MFKVGDCLINTVDGSLGYVARIDSDDTIESVLIATTNSSWGWKIYDDGEYRDINKECEFKPVASKEWTYAWWFGFNEDDCGYCGRCWRKASKVEIETLFYRPYKIEIEPQDELKQVEEPKKELGFDEAMIALDSMFALMLEAQEIKDMLEEEGYEVAIRQYKMSIYKDGRTYSVDR